MNLQALSFLHAIPYLIVVLAVLPYIFARWLGAGGLSLPGIVGGSLLALGGLGLSGWCSRLFVILGKGTQSPLEPTKRIVIGGPYRYVRNPILLGNLLLLLGEAALFASRGILVYTVLFFAAWHLILNRWEEPSLRRRFGKEYEDYRSDVPRWLPRLRRP